MKYPDATPIEIDDAVKGTHHAFQSYGKTSGEEKATFLRVIADEIEAYGSALLEIAQRETHLTLPRLNAERTRTTSHLRMFADLVEEGSWVEARIDTAIPDRMPSSKPDLRKMLVPIGPVVVFGASNFPFAYSTAGGDTVSALAAGCPVIVKAHPAHAETSQMVADAILRACKKTNMPSGIFYHVHGESFEVGKQLVKHPLVKAVGFTGSFAGGKALFDLANQRHEPIPVYAEMGSINPVFIFPDALKNRKGKIAEMYANSITQSVGQFCTNPGLLLGVKGNDLSDFSNQLSELMSQVDPAPMLHEGITSNYYSKRKSSLQQNGVVVLTEEKSNGNYPPSTSQKERSSLGWPMLATVDAKNFIENDQLKEEVFGP
ncbi:MAG: aldehyde dehydrogenase (NADP(+)), partial [Flammeovirgaceae bacterium]|nr:aldehyde dehydrogenase (NADP(+)) [Flammeovirgaceae bacterium]